DQKRPRVEDSSEPRATRAKPLRTGVHRPLAGRSLPERAQSQDSIKSRARVDTDRSGKPNNEPKEGDETQEQREALTEDEIRERQFVPTWEDYSHASSGFKPFFDPFQVWHVLKSRFGYKVTTVEEVLQKPPNPMFQVTVRIEHGSRREGRFVGAGSSIKSARHAAGVRLLAEWHASGSLLELFPKVDPWKSLNKKIRKLEAMSKMLEGQTKKYEARVKNLTVAKEKSAAAEEKKLKVEKRKLQAEHKLDKMDSARITRESNAKVEVYDYAARFRLIPQYELQYLEENAVEGTPAYYEHKIDLPEQGIHVTGRHKHFKGAEVAACLKFKQAAENYQREQNLIPKDTRTLSTHNVPDFFTMYQNNHRRGMTELETQKISLAAGKDQAFKVQVNIDGKPAGAPVIDQNERRAENLAYLSAAVTLSKESPTLLPDFFKQLRAGAGKIARALNNIEMLVNAKASNKIRDTLNKADNLNNSAVEDYENDPDEEDAPTIPRRHRFMLL
ncbi:hypothetical protein LTS18_009144, partial [Coniosporium uncinatum]